MTNEQIDLGAESERVRGELLLFRDSILPTFYLPGGLVPDTAAERQENPLARVIFPMKDWQRATMRLIESLPAGLGGGDVPEPDRSDFKPFMFQEARASYSVRDGRIRWRITLYAGTDADAALVFSWLGEKPDDPVGRIMADPHGVAERLIEIPVDNSALWNALSLIAPILADADPAVLRRLLDPETYRRRVDADRDVLPETYRDRLRILGKWFGHVLNNALLHAVAGLANNHFDEIPDLLGHPNVQGRYADLMLHYTFAVLFEKVRILHGLARGDYSL